MILLRRTEVFYGSRINYIAKCIHTTVVLDTTRKRVGLFEGGLRPLTQVG